MGLINRFKGECNSSKTGAGKYLNKINYMLVVDV